MDPPESMDQLPTTLTKLEIHIARYWCLSYSLEIDVTSLHFTVPPFG